MTPWLEFTDANVRSSVPEEILGVFQLSRTGDKVHYVGRADQDLRGTLMALLDKGYKNFQWVQVPWSKESFEMHCRLFHHGGGKGLDNLDHPYPPEGKQLRCPMSAQPVALCEIN